MKKINNPDGSVTYRIEDRGVQETISENMLNTLKRMPRTMGIPENWYEARIAMNLILKWNELQSTRLDMKDRIQ